PYFASVFLVVYSLNIPIRECLPYGLLLSFFHIVIAYMLFKYVESRDQTFNLHYDETGRSYKKLYELIAIIVLLTGLIFALEPFVPWSVIVLISLLVLGFTYFWSVYLQETRAFFQELNVYRKTIFPHKANEINLLLTAGLFG